MRKLIALKAFYGKINIKRVKLSSKNQIPDASVGGVVQNKNFRVCK